MGQIFLGMNLEAIRRHEKPFEWGVEKAAELGYDYIEPMVHWGRELMSEAKYYHTVSMWDDPLRIRRAAEKAGLKVSGLQAHGPICRPDVHGDYLKHAIRYAAECGAPVVNTDEGVKAPWTTEEEDHVLMRYMLYEVAQMAEPRGIKIGLECHSQYSKTPEGPRPDLQPRPVAGHRHQPRHGQRLPRRPGCLRLAGTGRRSAGPPSCQGHHRRTLVGRAWQGHRDPGGLCLRRRRDRLATGH